MPMNKPHLEFHKVDMSKGWVTPPGYPSGIAAENPGERSRRDAQDGQPHAASAL